MAKNISNQIRMLQAARGLNDSQTADMLGIMKQNYSRKLKNKTFSVSDLEKISNTLDFDVEITFTDRKSGKKIEW